MYRLSWLQIFLIACLPSVVPAQPLFEPGSCEPAAAESGARCGIVYVPEDHANPLGRRIPLHVVVLPATGAQGDGKRAQYDLEGGPGFAATDFLAMYACFAHMAPLAFGASH